MSIKSSNENSEEELSSEISETPKRYFILFLFFILIVVDGFQWICFAGITNIIAEYYGVGNLAVNSIASINMVMFLIFTLPANIIMERIGLRASILFGSAGTAIGSIAQCFSVDCDRFYVAILSHILMGLVKPFFSSLNSKLVSVWFPDHQVGLATAICVIGDALGTALGFTIPGWFVGVDSGDTVRIEWGLSWMLYILALISLVDTFLIYLFFDDQPKKAPGIARSKQIEEQNRNGLELESLKAKAKTHMDLIVLFFKDPNFRLICIAFGLNLGANYAFDILLNQILVGDPKDIQKAQKSLPLVGNVGMIILSADIVGSLVCGYLLDRYHAYKSISILMYLLCLVSVAMFALGLNMNSHLLLYITSLPVGFFITGYSCCGYECAVEACYPNSELLSTSLLNMSGQVFGVIIVYVSSVTIDSYGEVSGCCLICGFLALGLLLTCLTKADYRRNKAIRESWEQTQEMPGEREKVK